MNDTQLNKLKGAKVELIRDRLERKGEQRSLEQILLDFEDLLIPCHRIASILNVPLDTIYEWRRRLGLKRREWKKETPAKPDEQPQTIVREATALPEASNLNYNKSNNNV